MNSAPHSSERRTVFVTGAGGFLGRHVSAGFEAVGWRAVRLGHGLNCASDESKAGLSVEGPVDAQALSRAAALAGAPAVIVHAAGGSSVAASVADPATDFERTMGSLCAVLDFMRRQAPQARLVFLSSAAVYGSSGLDAISERTPLNPISPYGLHKKLAEDMIQGWARLWNLDAAILRLFSVYGPGNRKQLFWDIANRVHAAPKRLELSGSGDEVRDFLYVDDAVEIIRTLAEAKPGDAPVIVNGGSGTAVGIRRAAEALCRCMGVETEIVFTGNARAGDPARMISDPSFARSLGFAPKVSFDAGVRQLAEWVRGAIGEAEGKTVR